MPQFGALVTNGQEELASLAYLVTMRWAESNADVTRAIGDYYEMRMKEIGTRHPGKIQNVEGKRHMTTVYFHSLDAANSVARELNRRGLDISVQSYKTNCPPVLLTKLPLISTLEVVEFVISRFEEALQTAQAQEK
jgi:4-aminobutyrate aminotransferase-like enzyme